MKGRQLALIALFAGAAAISFAPILVRLSEIGPSATAFWRVAFSVPILAFWMTLEGKAADAPRRPVGFRDHGRLCLAGVLFAADLAMFHWSITLTSVANATVLANNAPIFVALAAYFLFGERFRPGFLAGLALAILGAAVLMGSSLSLSTRHLFGDAVGIGTAAFYGAYILAVGRLRADFSTATIMTWSGLVCAVFLLPIVAFSSESLIAASWLGWLVLIGLALISHVGGQSLITFALAHLSATFGSVGLMAQPVASALLAWLILSEAMGPLQIAGAILVLIGIFMANRSHNASLGASSAVGS